MIDTREDLEVFDPNMGRPDVKVYTNKTLKTWADLIEVIDCRATASVQRTGEE